MITRAVTGRAVNIAALDGSGHRGGAVRDAELAECARQMGLDRRLADEQPLTIR
jgi:hypothetical protein